MKPYRLYENDVSRRRRAKRRRQRAFAFVLALAFLLAGSAAIAVALGDATRRSSPSGSAARYAQSGEKRHSAKRPKSNRPNDARSRRAYMNEVPPSPQRRLKLKKTITGDITPKSIVASGTGLFFAQNMMYRHTVTVYDGRRRLVKTIPDTVRLAKFGLRKYRGRYRGAPVEAAFSPDARYAYVSNYNMYGPGFTRPGDDVCSPSGGYDRSFLYRIDTETLEIDDVVRVGSVPKFVAVTPNGRFVLVANWCSWDLTVIAAETGRAVKRVALGPYPRGIAVDPRSRTAYVAVMGSPDIAKVDLRSFTVDWIRGVGQGPRHLVVAPGGRYLYATLNAEGTVAKIDLRNDVVVRKVTTGSQPRSMTISGDGKSLYVVNYSSNTVSKIRAGDLRILQTVATNASPIGITYDSARGELWVACYSGSILVFRDA